jgi:prepilin-type N-terminal cleavage/methylation domain-containing protein
LTRNNARERRESDQQGFTLVELVVALALLAIVAVGFLTSTSLGFRTVAVARQRQTASELATARLEHLRNVPYDQVALSSAPSHNADATHPNHWVSTDGATYDISGEGDVEDLIVDTANGDVLLLEDPVQVGSTVMEIYQYATWVDDPAIPGTQDYRRVTVVVRYKAPSSNGVNQFVRASTLFTPGTVTITGGGSSTTTTTPPGSTTVPSSTTTTTSGSCLGDTTAPTGSFSIGASGAADAGYTASQNASLHMSFADGCLPIVVNFSNDGATWGTDVVYDASSPQVSWPLSPGNGPKTVHGRVRDGAGNTVVLPVANVILDATPPTTPSGVTYSISCSGPDRTIDIDWGASVDGEGNLWGYRVEVSTDGSTWSQDGTTVSTSYSDVHKKNSTSIRFRVAAYDRAGNSSETAPSPAISLVKNQCS